MPPKQKQNADSRLETLKREIAELRDKGDVEKEKFVLYGQRIEAIDARIDEIGQRFDRMEEMNELLITKQVQKAQVELGENIGSHIDFKVEQKVEATIETVTAQIMALDMDERVAAMVDSVQSQMSDIAKAEVFVVHAELKTLAKGNLDCSEAYEHRFNAIDAKIDSKFEMVEELLDIDNQSSTNVLLQSMHDRVAMHGDGIAMLTLMQRLMQQCYL